MMERPEWETFALRLMNQCSNPGHAVTKSEDRHSWKRFTLLNVCVFILALGLGIKLAPAFHAEGPPPFKRQSVTEWIAIALIAGCAIAGPLTLEAPEDTSRTADCTEHGRVALDSSFGELFDPNTFVADVPLSSVAAGRAADPFGNLGMLGSRFDHRAPGSPSLSSAASP